MSLKDTPWEDQISLNTNDNLDFEVLAHAEEYREADAHPTNWDNFSLPLEEAGRLDTYPLPITADREGYYGPHHYSYWASGLRDRQNLVDMASRNGLEMDTYLDMGCATGRVIRHFALLNPEIQVYGSDINRRHVEWVNRYLPNTIIAFQNHSIPTLPLPDNSISLISAFSIFTHIESFETAWLLELKRILKPGGMAWVTVHTEKTWSALEETWPLYKALANHPEYKKIKHEEAMPSERLTFRWKSDRSYSSNVFYSYEYINRMWGRLFEIVETHHRLPGFQDVIVLRKT